jgi:two-component system cell cycle response regulator
MKPGAENMRVLLADDDALYRHSLQSALERWGYEVTTALDGNKALDILQEADPPRIAILDWMMPGMDGVGICSRVRERNNDPYVYIVLITAKDKKRDVIAGLKAQADDYLIKPFNLEELRARLQSGQRIIELQAALALKQQELSHQATHDSLTGIWNRSAILDILDREIARSRDSKKSLCVALSDIDHFKRVNDTYGHAAGDAVLMEVALRMQSALRHYDAIGRYGGEEFIVVMPGLDHVRALRLAERLRVQVAEQPYNVMNTPVYVSVSTGVAVNNNAECIEPLLQAADEALYRAKARGRNCVEVFRGGGTKEIAFSSRFSLSALPHVPRGAGK